jgi:hypothetical protein
MPHFFRTLLVLFAGLLTMRAAAADGGALIAEMVTYSDVRRVIPSDTAERFEKLVKATDDQKRATLDLIAASRADLARVVNRHLRAVRDDVTLEEMRSSEAEVLRAAAKVERAMLDDLKETLAPEQTESFARFERSHRRTLLKGRTSLALSFDVAEFLRGKGADITGDNEVASVLSTFDVEQDAALVRERKAVLAYYDNVRRGIDGTPESAKRDRDAQNAMFLAGANLRRVQSTVLTKLVGVLPSELGDQLVREVMRTRAQGFDRTAASPDQYPVVREVLTLTLREEQRSQVKAIVNDAERQMIELCRKAVIDQATFELADNQTRQRYPTAPTNEFWGKASELRKKVSREVLELLTAEQRSVYDASAVLEPSESSRVEEEP